MQNGIEKTLDDVRIIEVPQELFVHGSARATIEACRQYLLGIEDPAEQTSLARTLNAALAHIDAVAQSVGERAQLFADHAPLSFTWLAAGLFGGLLFHGVHDGFGSGSAPTFAVTLEPTFGWRIHT